MSSFKDYAMSCNENRTQLQPFNQRSSTIDKIHDSLEITRHKDFKSPCTIESETYGKHKFGTNEDTESYYSKF